MLMKHSSMVIQRQTDNLLAGTVIISTPSTIIDKSEISISYQSVTPVVSVSAESWFLHDVDVYCSEEILQGLHD